MKATTHTIRLAAIASALFTLNVNAVAITREDHTSSNGLEARNNDGNHFDSIGSVPHEKIQELQHDLLLAPSFADKQEVLFPNPSSGDASNITFQFVNNTVAAPTGGSIVLASVDNFPALTGSGATLAIGFLNPCGLNTPHAHPRGTEFLTVVQGKVTASLILELDPGAEGNVIGADGKGSGQVFGPAPAVTAELDLYHSILFPRGEFHYEFNPTCEPAVFVSSFDNIDPGRIQIEMGAFSVVPDEVLETALGGRMDVLDASRLDQLRQVIPGDAALLMGECAKRCGIDTSGKY